MSPSRPALGVSIGITLAAALWPSASHAFCRTTSCSTSPIGTGQLCTPADPNDCGKPLFWPSPCVGFTLQQDASKQVPLKDAETIFNTAFDAWKKAQCPGGGTPRVRVDYLGPVSCDAQEYNYGDKKSLGNANIIMFRDDMWPHSGANNTLALTTVTFNTETGEIYDADMEVNTATNTITTGDTGVEFDLLSIATHEAGHFLGLAHSPLDQATMTTQYMPGSLDIRTLDSDDQAGICDIYPPGTAIPASCDTTPRHGFSALCSDDPRPAAADDGGCSIRAPGSRRPNPAFSALSLGLAAFLAARKYRSRR